MIDPFAFVVIALAGWRVAYMLTNEAGPGNIFGGLRERLLNDSFQIPEGSLRQLGTCVYCMSFWTCAAAALLWDTPLWGAVLFIAIWGAATALDMVARRDG